MNLYIIYPYPCIWVYLGAGQKTVAWEEWHNGVCGMLVWFNFIKHMSSVQNLCWLMMIVTDSGLYYPIYWWFSISNGRIPVNQAVQWNKKRGFANPSNQLFMAMFNRFFGVSLQPGHRPVLHQRDATKPCACPWSLVAKRQTCDASTYGPK